MAIQVNYIFYVIFFLSEPGVRAAGAVLIWPVTYLFTYGTYLRHKTLLLRERAKNAFLFVGTRVNL